MKYFLALLLGAALIFSCRYIGGKRVKGNGNVETEQRSVSSFDGVVSHGSFDVTVLKGDVQKVEVRADENLLQYIETHIEDGKLHIDTRHGYNLRPRTDMRIMVTAQNFNELSSYGSGNIKGENPLTATENAKLHLSGSGKIDVILDAPSVDAEISGSGDIRVKGNAHKLESTIHGSGNIRAGELTAREARVEIAGSGDVEISASDKLDINIMGSGGVKYRGDAQVNTSIAGSGSVRKMN